MGEIVNLNRARKARARREREAAAETNRARFGRNVAETANDRRQQERHERTVDGARRDDPPAAEVARTEDQPDE
jgi:hypothetical protein